jgi:radical SAM protein with 4Fe4S-binding SPASM domain
MDKKFSDSLLTTRIDSNIVDKDQIFISENLDDDFILALLSANFDTLESVDEPLARKIIKNVRENGRLNFPISNHEVFFCRSINNPVRMLKYLTFRYRFYLASSEKRVFDAPPLLLLEPVSACNLRCPMCFQVDKTFNRKPFMGIMKWDLFTRLVDEADELGIGAITLASRGEPMMHPNFGEMLVYVAAKKNIFELKINTNATFLTEELCHKIFESGVSTAVISADHYEKESYEELRKGADFEKIVLNVAMLHDIREKHYPDSFTEIRVSGIDYYKNLDRQKFAEFWAKHSDSVSASFPMERWDTYNNEPHENINSPCSFLWDRMYVWFDGICNPCDEDYKSYVSYGNIKDSTIKEIWNSAALFELRQKHLNKERNSITPCDRCGIDFC